MIIKPFQIPKEFLGLEALMQRVLPNSPNKGSIMSDYNKSKTGLEGEKEVFYQLNFLPQNQFHILHDIRLPDPFHPFQMDYVLPSKGFILQLEVKNFKGTVDFNDFGQLIVTSDSGKKCHYENPLNQAERHVFQLQNWLAFKHFPPIPIVKLVVFGPSTTLKNTQAQSSFSFDQFVSYSNLLSRIREISQSYQHSIYSDSTLGKLSNCLFNSHMPLEMDLLKKHNESFENLIKGVICPQCSHVPMIRDYGKWFCPKCKFSGKSVHVSALNHYYLLCGMYINNRQARDFLLLESETVARYLLKKLDYKVVGKNSGSKYLLKYIP